MGYSSVYISANSLINNFTRQKEPLSSGNPVLGFGKHSHFTVRPQGRALPVLEHLVRLDVAGAKGPDVCKKEMSQSYATDASH